LRFGINYDTTESTFLSVGPSAVRRIWSGASSMAGTMVPFAGQSGEVSGCITMDESPPVGTNFWWAGLIHEFVGVANNYVDRISVDVGVP